MSGETGVTIREAGEGDVAGMFEVRVAVRENAMGWEELARLGITAASVTASLKGCCTGWVAVADGGEVVGFSIGDREKGTVFALFVRPGWEGRGIGGALLDRVVGWLWGCGWEVVWLTTGAGTRAEGFYRRRGWRDVGREADGQVRFELGRVGEGRG